MKTPDTRALLILLRWMVSLSKGCDLPEVLAGFGRVYPELEPAIIHDALNTLLMNGTFYLTREGKYCVTLKNQDCEVWNAGPFAEHRK